MSNQVLQVIDSRRSIRKYRDKEVSREDIEALVRAALISPSAVNKQPWHLKVITNRPTILEWEKDIVQHYIDTKDEWVIERLKGRDNKVFYHAPLVFLISMEEEKAMDVGIMAQTICLAAKSLGLDSIILGFPRVSFYPEHNNKWQDRFDFPEGHVYGISVAVGYGDMEGNDREIDRSKVSYME